MKLKHLTFSCLASALMIFAGCSADDDFAQTSNNIDSEKMVAYANIKLALPAASGTRADGDGDGNYEYGTGNEYTINTVLLVFYGPDGQPVGTVTKKAGDGWGQTSAPGDNNNIESFFGNSPVKIEMFQPVDPIYALAFVNYGNAEQFKTKSLEEASGTNLTTPDYRTSDGFIMTSTGWYDEGKDPYQAATKVSGFIYATEDDAKAAYANKQVAKIYVERVAAKVEVLFVQGEDAALIPGVDAGDYVLTFIPEEWGVTANATESYLTKQMDALSTYTGNDYADGFASWMNAYNDHRTYWAKSWTWGQINQTPATGKGGDYGRERETALSYITYGDLTAISTESNSYLGVTNSAYVLEHTYPKSVFENKDNRYAVITSVVIKGSYGITKAADASEGADAEKFYDNGKIQDFYVRTLNGKRYVYTPTEAVKAMAEGQQIVYIKNAENNNYEPAPADAFKLVHHKEYYNPLNQTNTVNAANGYVLELELEGENTYYYATGNTEDPYAEITAEGEVGTAGALADINRQLQLYAGIINLYNGGEAFFYVPIRHYTGSSNDPDKGGLLASDIHTGDYGIVRNHIYRLTITSINGLATGKPNPDDPDPDPEIPDTPLPDPDPAQEYWINAELNVLSWHRVSYNVEL